MIPPESGNRPGMSGAPQTPMNARPLLSICVPTRNRARYLEHCLKTILDQEFSDYEVIVAENSDPEEREHARQVMARLDSGKIEYFEQPRVVSMTENYEAALQKSKGHYCLCIGDDDGLVAGTLGFVAGEITRRAPEVLKSPPTSYFWPGSPWHPETALYLAVAGHTQWVDSKSALAKVASFETPYYFLPMIYYSFVRRDVIDRITARQGSFFSDAAAIDVYSGMTIAANTDSFMICERSFAIAGQSPKSTGAAYLENAEDAIRDEYKAHHSLEAQCARFRLPRNNSLDVLTLLELLRTAHHFPEALEYMRIDKAECFRRCCGLIGKYGNTREDIKKRSSVLEEFREADPDFDWQAAFAGLDRGAGNGRYFPRGELFSFTATKVVGPEVVRCNDVHDASKVAESIYSGRELDHLVVSSACARTSNRSPARSFAKRLKASVRRLFGR